MKLSRLVFVSVLLAQPWVAAQYSTRGVSGLSLGHWRNLQGADRAVSPYCSGAQRPARQMNQPDQAKPAQFFVLVKKAERKLYVYRVVNGQRQLFKSYTIALGPNPTGHKQRQGDGATPEGDYYLTHKNPKSNYYLSLGVSYPNSRDAAVGLQAGLITKAEHDAILTALQAQAKPPQNTKLGGDIFIHGGGTGRDWTLGCVALENAEIKELFELLPVKTPVQIVP